MKKIEISKKVVIVISILASSSLLCVLCLFYSVEHDVENSKCTIPLGYKLEEGFFDGVEVEGDSYFDIVRSAIKGDTVAVRRLSVAHIPSSGGFYTHSRVLSDIITIIGEKKYLNIISSFSDAEKSKIVQKIQLATDNGDTFSEKYPILYDSLQRYIHY